MRKTEGFKACYCVMNVLRSAEMPNPLCVRSVLEQDGAPDEPNSSDACLLFSLTLFKLGGKKHVIPMPHRNNSFYI